MVKQNIPKEPFLFGLFSTKPHKKLATGALFFVLVATGLDRFSVVMLKNLTDSVTAQPIIFNVVCFAQAGVVGMVIFPKGIKTWKWWVWVIANLIVLNVVANLI